MDTSRLLTSHNNNIPTHEQPVGVGQHCKLRLGGHLTLTNITQQQHIPTHQQPVGVGQHCQLRLGGHLTLTNITQQQHTNSRLARGYTVSLGWVDTSRLLAITDMRTDRQTGQTDRQNSNLVSSPSHYAILFSIIPFTSSPSHHPLHIIPSTSSPSNHNRNLTSSWPDLQCAIMRQ